MATNAVTLKLNWQENFDMNRTCWIGQKFGKYLGQGQQITQKKLKRIFVHKHAYFISIIQVLTYNLYELNFPKKKKLREIEKMLVGKIEGSNHNRSNTLPN